MHHNRILTLCLSTPFRHSFDYLLTSASEPPQVGTRVSAPFGHQQAIMGIVVDHPTESKTPSEKLRPVNKVLDTTPVFSKHMLDLCHWCADYYHYPLGEVLHMALPALLRKPEPMLRKTQTFWSITESGAEVDTEQLQRAPRQQQALKLLQIEKRLTQAYLKQQKISIATLKALAAKSWIERKEREPSMMICGNLANEPLKQPPLALNHEQQQALTSIKFDRSGCYLLEGVTGSGKTEVYLQAIEQVLQQNRQALVLVPEIGLTPQTLSRFETRFNVPIALLHSGLNDKQRLDVWRQARQGHLSIVIGTRSSIFTPLNKLGLIVVDEEHDSSYKQMEGVRYSARDLAVVRAQKLKIPVILGSATPSLETLHNVLSGRYQHLELQQRAIQRSLPGIECVDGSDSSLTELAEATISQALAQNQQVLVFINRRGYSPILSCQHCGWISQCPHCDSRMTLHRTQRQQQLHCHCCDHRSSVPSACPHCHSKQLQTLGAGTQRKEETLAAVFDQIPILRIDRDSVSRKGQLEEALGKIQSGKPCILVGTQMLAKGHHFPNLGLAVILGLDHAFFSSDFRGAERMGQLLTQVAGRVGRDRHQGRVIIQTQFAGHPMLQQLIKEGYHRFAESLLAERKLTGMPPWQHLALIRCHAQQPQPAEAFLQQLRRQGEKIAPPHPGLQYLGPFAAHPEKRNNRYHYILQIKAANRQERQQLLDQLSHYLVSTKPVRGLRWLIDVDPLEF